MEDMGIRIGNWDPLQLSFNILDTLLKKGAITVEEAKEILKKTLPNEMTEQEKDNIVNSMIIHIPKTPKQ